MAEKQKTKRLSKVAREFNVGISTIVDFLNKQGIEIESNPNTKIDADTFSILLKEYSSDIELKEESEKIELNLHKKKESISLEETEVAEEKEKVEDKQEPKAETVEKKEKVKEDKPKEKEKKTDSETKNAKKKTTTEKPKDEKPKEEPKPKEDKPKAKSKSKTKDADAEPTADDNVGIKIVGKIDPDTLKKKSKSAKKETDKTEKVNKKEQEESTTKTKKEEPKKEEVKTKEKQPKKEKIQEQPQEETPEEIKTEVEQLENVKVVGKINLDDINQKTRPDKKTKEQKDKERKLKNEGRNGKRAKKISADDYDSYSGKKKGKDFDDDDSSDKKKRKRIHKDKIKFDNAGGKDRKKNKQGKTVKKEVNEEDVQQQIKDTYARLISKKSKSKGGAKYRREKREAINQKAMEEMQKIEQERNIIKVTEFVSVAELATMMNVTPNDVISTCMGLGLFVSINQRLDAETMALLADEFGYKIEFVSAEVLDAISEEEDKEEDLIERPPIVTVMGHVDHGKTSLLDYIRNANVIAGEAGGITQHIGAYGVKLKNGKRITFLDTPGHEAFTAMRARGTQVTDIVIVIVAADDNVMPQTVEAINHAQAAGVPIVFAINKIDKPNANPDKIKEELANMNLLVEEWGGKYQSQDISAKKGLNIEELLEKVMLEAELLELKANPNRKATGTVIEASLDKGRGYVTNMLVQNGTLRIGDILLAGNYTGHVKAMYNEHNEAITEATPSQAVLLLGLNGAPQAGDKFNIMDSDREAKEIANRRQQLAREQGMRTQKHITLDEIGRRIAVGNFQELNIIVKGDVDGSVEAISDSLIKLSTDEIQVNVIRKAVGQISETDIILAAASDAIIIGFQVRPSLAARKQAEKEEIDIRLYSVIYDAINEVKAAMEGMLSPDIKEEIVATVEVRETFKITKVGTIAGCFVRDGKIKRSDKIRVIRDGIVVYTGELGSLKRFKDDVKEVASGYECGLNIDKYNDIKVGDIVEAYHEVEVKRTL